METIFDHKPTAAELDEFGLEDLASQKHYIDSIDADTALGDIAQLYYERGDEATGGKYEALLPVDVAWRMFPPADCLNSTSG